MLEELNASGNCDFRSEQLAGGRVVRFTVDFGSSPASYLDVLARWKNDAAFRAAFDGLLAELPFSAFRWETPSVTTATADRPFEFVVLDSPGLDRNPDAEAFAEHFDHGGPSGIVEFQNLGRDAIMIVPCPAGPLTAYGHLAAFVRGAPEPQRHALWIAVAAAMERRLSEKPVWLSTAGAGVTWLHVRLDDRPKYYGYAPYREWPGSRL